MPAEIPSQKCLNSKCLPIMSQDEHHRVCRIFLFKVSNRNHNVLIFQTLAQATSQVLTLLKETRESKIKWTWLEVLSLLRVERNVFRYTILNFSWAVDAGTSSIAAPTTRPTVVGKQFYFNDGILSKLVNFPLHFQLNYKLFGNFELY